MLVSTVPEVVMLGTGARFEGLFVAVTPGSVKVLPWATCIVRSPFKVTRGVVVADEVAVKFAQAVLVEVVVALVEVEVRLTNTRKEEVAVLPFVSVAVQLTVVVPRINVEPVGGKQVTVTLPPDVEDAVGLKFTDVPLELFEVVLMSA